MLIRNQTGCLREKRDGKKNLVLTAFYNFFALIILLPFLAGCAASPALKTPQRNSASLPSPVSHLDKLIATINGMPLAAREYRWHLNKNRSLVVRDIIAQYDIPDPAHFWTVPIDGATPWQRLSEQALDYAISFKLEQMLAREKGLSVIMTYPELLHRMQLENARRSKGGKHLPGPAHFTAEEFYFYEQGRIHFELMKTMGENELAVDDDDVKEYYEANKNTLYLRQVTSRRIQTQPFEEIKDTVRRNLIEIKYNDWLQELRKRAVIVVEDVTLDEQKETVMSAAEIKLSKPKSAPGAATPQH